ncbi:MAG: PepSY-associated TM helix domain-containing protein [Pseudomonadota bacterium]
MKSIQIKKLYTIHSWVGIITGILLFVIALTGAISVFGKPEIKIWANPDIRHGYTIDTKQLEQVIAKQAGFLPAEYRQEILVFLPGVRGFANLTILFEDHEAEDAVLLTFDNKTLEVNSRAEGSIADVFASRQTDIADFIVDFHADLHLGRPIGLLLTGILGLTLMASIVTGFVIHRQKLKQLFTFRPKKSTDITLADAHKVFGVWGLIFNGVIGFTGAFLGLATVIHIPAAAFVSFNGDQEKLIETFNTTPPPTLTANYAETQLAPVIEHAYSYDEDMSVDIITIYGYQDENARIYVSGTGGDTVSTQILAYEGATGEFTEAFGQFGKVGGVSAVILDLMFPLHFGNFGGEFVKIIWAVLGLSTALLPLSGMMLWIERGQNAASPQHAASTYDRFNRLVIGACGGALLACAVLFPTQLILYAMNITENNGFYIGTVFFAVWVVTAVYPFTLHSTAIVAKHFGYTLGGILVLTLPLNLVTTGDHAFSLLINGSYVSGVMDLVLLSTGVLSIYITAKMNKQKAGVSTTEKNLKSPPSKPQRVQG